MQQNKDQYPNQLSRKYNRRAKAAAWASGIPGIFGGVVSIEAAFAQPAAAVSARPNAVGHNSTLNPISKNKHAAAPERIQQAEQSPQAFIDRFDKRLGGLVKQMHSSPYFKSMHQEQLSKAFHTDVSIRYMSVPSKEYPHRYDFLTVAVREDNDVPLTSDIVLGLTAKKPSPSTRYEKDYIVSQASDSGKVMSHSMVLLASDGHGASNYFGVSSEGYPDFLMPKSGTKYSDKTHQTQVAAGFNNFLNQFENIINRR